MAQTTRNVTAVESEALEWVLDLAFDDQQHYLSVGDQTADYGDEWPEIARTRAEHCRQIAADFPSQAGRWSDLAQEYLDSIGGDDEQA